MAGFHTIRLKTEGTLLGDGHNRVTYGRSFTEWFARSECTDRFRRYHYQSVRLLTESPGVDCGVWLTARIGPRGEAGFPEPPLAGGLFTPALGTRMGT